MKELLEQYYNISGATVKKLNGYENVNYLVETGDESFILKTYGYDQGLLDYVLAESNVLVDLSGKDQMRYPRPISTIDGEKVKVVIHNEDKVIVRLLTFMSGTFLGDAFCMY